MAADNHDALPRMTESDLHVLLRMLVGLTIMGAVEVRFHPCRFPLIFDAMLRYGGIVDPAAIGSSLSEISIPISAPNPITGEMLQSIVVQWAPCPEENCEGCKAIVDQESRYPRPPDDPSRIWTPS